MRKRFAIFSLLLSAYFFVLAHALVPHVHNNDVYENICAFDAQCHQEADILHRLFEVIFSVDIGEEHLQNFVRASSFDQAKQMSIAAWKMVFINAEELPQPKTCQSLYFQYGFFQEYFTPSDPLANSQALRGPPVS